MRQKIALYLDLIRWDRPAGWFPLLWPALSALWLGAKGFPGWHLLLVFVAGAMLTRSAGCCINDVADYRFDKHVKRTAKRPVTTGEISRKEALLVGVILALVSFLLVLTTNRYAVGASFLAVVIAIFYPFTKRFLPIPQMVLGVAYSFGVPMAFLAAGLASELHRSIVYAFVLMVGNWFWVMAYDTVYAMVDRDDDLKISIKTSAITFGVYDLLAVFLCNVVYLVIWSWALYTWFSGWGIWTVAVAINLVLVLWHSYLIRHRQREACFKSFTTSHYIGFVFLLGIAAQYFFTSG